ncbi:MAG: hypothetical protein RIG88_05420 [Roseitalea porphyridii]|jgi:hypothetical protein|uniref:hypothetical protein n=2 Tax=Roseitalea porphyridii TaxID=1852022 RepID=UPI0032EB101A
MNPFQCAGPKGDPDADRSTERLVLAAYRHYAGAPARHDDTLMDRPHFALAGDLPTDGRRIVVAALYDFVEALGRCSRCPLRASASEADEPAPAEKLILALIAAIQAGDDRVADLCLRSLSCPSRCQPVALAAGNLALILKGVGRTLAPVPLPLVRKIIEAETSADTPVAAAIRPAPVTLH